jgi:hypothetical protein
VGLLKRIKTVGSYAGRSCGGSSGADQATSPLAFWWLDTATVYALGLVQTASVYIGFAVADGRWLVIAFETNIAAIFVVIAAAAVHAIAMAARRRPYGPRAQGSLAAPKSFCREHPVVAPVLPGPPSHCGSRSANWRRAG